MLWVTGYAALPAIITGGTIEVLGKPNRSRLLHQAAHHPNDPDHLPPVAARAMGGHLDQVCTVGAPPETLDH
jgi:hypothetical protein